MAVTKEQILAAADQIAAAGERPTLEAVRQIVGGSYTTISPVLNEWKARQKEAAAPLREPAPQAVGERLAEVGADIWAMALGLANSRLATEREAMEKARADMEAAQAETAELADKLSGEVEALQSRLASIEAAELAARTEVDGLRGQLTVSQEQAHTAEARAVEIERRADELRIELDRAHQEADQARQALAEQQKVNQATTAQVDRLRDELSTVKAKAEAADQAHQEQRRQVAADAQRQAEQLSATQAERDQARQEASKAREDAARLAGQLQTHQEQTAAILARLAPVEAKPEDAVKPSKARK
jgi:colicin import membrane protein